MKKTKDENDEKAGKDPMEKLVKLTKLMKEDKIKIAQEQNAKSFSSRNNKWRSQSPKFTEKTEKPADVVQAGGMDVDPARKEEYENWRKDKQEEQKWRRVVALRKAEAARKAKAEETTPDY